MADLNISSAEASDLQTAVKDYSVPSQDTDASSETKETRWQNTEWSQYLGYYKEIPELAAAIDAKATWTVGKGVKTDPQTTFILQSIKGWGKDTFNTILENAVRTYHIGGDFFAEIIRDEDGNLINLKPLDPKNIVIIVDGKGIIKRYEQESKVKSPPKEFGVDKIFHIARNRVADEIHGVSIIQALENIILMRNEAMADQKQLMHRHVKPIVKFILDTDDDAKISAFKAKADKIVADGENLYLPKDTAEHEIISVPTNATLNPLPWINTLNNYFFQAVGVPQIIVGGSQEFTEATAKIAYLAFQQTIEEEQLFLEEQVGMQLGMEIELEFPASLENDLLSDNKKDGAENVQPNETTAGAGQ
jgi:hypothetical protein